MIAIDVIVVDLFATWLIFFLFFEELGLLQHLLLLRCLHVWKHVGVDLLVAFLCLHFMGLVYFNTQSSSLALFLLLEFVRISISYSRFFSRCAFSSFDASSCWQIRQVDFTVELETLSAVIVRTHASLDKFFACLHWLGVRLRFLGPFLPFFLPGAIRGFVAVILLLFERRRALAANMSSSILDHHILRIYHKLILLWHDVGGLGLWLLFVALIFGLFVLARHLS